MRRDPMAPGGPGTGGIGPGEADSGDAGAHGTATVLSIGDELALGQTLDTNSMWVADRLWSLGVRPIEHATVDDDEARIAAAMERLGGAADLLIVTGGLGPTADDLTRQGLARVLGGGPGAEPVEMIEDAGAMEALVAWFARRRGAMPAANAVQALRPRGARCLANPNGTAPGLYARVERLGCDVYCLPGPPHEMRPMLEAEVVPGLRRLGGRACGVRLIVTFGLGESVVAERLGGMMDRDRPGRGLPLVGTTASKGMVTCRLRHEAGDGARLGAELDAAEAQVAALLGPAVIDRRDPARGDSLEIEGALASAVVGLLKGRGAMLAVAESCTGGLLGEMVTAVFGSSAAFWGGWLTYANDAKAAMGVEAGLIERHGAVSREVARAMAQSAWRRARAAEARVGYALAITGIAGPGGASEAKPVGTVWIALASPGDDDASGGCRVESRRFLFRGGRGAIREWSARAALGMLRLRLIGASMPLLGEVSEPEG